MFVENVRSACLRTATHLVLLCVAVPAGAQEGIDRQPDSPLDQLRPEDIPEYERSVAEARHHGRLPEGLVEILGDSRWHHANLVVDIAVTPDGAQCVTASGPSLVLWDLQTGAAVRVMSQAFRRRLLTLSLSGDGRTVAAGDTSGDVTLWDLPEGRLRQRLALRGGAVALSRDGRRIVTADQGMADIGSWGAVTGRFEMISSIRAPLAESPQHLDATVARILLWDADSGLTLRTVVGNATLAPRSMVVNDRGELLAACSADGSVLLWNIAQRKLLWKCRPAPDVSALDVQFSHDGRSVWVLTSSHLIPLDVILGRAGAPVAVPRGTTCFDFLPGGERAVIACGGLRILRLPAGELEPPFEPAAHHGNLIAVAFAPGGNRLATGGDDGSIIIWDVATGRPQFRFTEHIAPVPALAWNPDGSLLASGDEQGRLMFWETATGRRIDSRPGPRWVQRLCFDRQGRRLAAAGADGTVELWDLSRWTALRATDQWNRSQTHAAFLPDGGALLTSAGIIDVESGRYRRSNSRSDTVSAASPDGGLGIVRGEVRNLETGNAIAELSGGDLLSMAVFSPDGNDVAGFTAQGRLMLWDAATGAVKGSQMVSEPGALPGTLTFSHDGRYLAYPAGNGTVHIVRLPLPGHDGAVPER